MFLWFIYQFRFKLYSKSLALVLLLLPFSCFTCSYHYCWSLDLWPNWYPLTVPVRPLWKHEQLRRAGLTELIFRLFCQGETTWIRESVSTCAGLQLPLLMIIFCFLLVYFVLCPDHSLVVNFKSCFVLLLKFCFLNGVFFCEVIKRCFVCNHMFCTYTSSYTFFIFMLSLLVISILM